ncbi:DUF6759 domain-containing protein [Soonwooa sp.]|uniref:DUF6759 domain-containing protein n=1 Tax=Soonwooa sp. TaxID=1938592 RepID=UPI002610AE8B|nr:DUF6759 domain-containing protein [Soonwooa sp.]
MKRVLCIVGLALLTACASNSNADTGKKHHITQSTDIKEIENYLKNAHKDDQYRLFLKRKLIALKNAAWMKSGQGVPMAARPIVTDLPTNPKSNKIDRELFNKLLSEAKTNQKKNTVNVLNELFNDSNPNSPTSIVLIQNKSVCDMILTLEGPKLYNLAIPANSDTSITVEKGTYKLQSNVCDAAYSSTKTITKGIVISLNTDKLATKN